MRHLNGVYTQYINRKHERVGHVFQGRYKAVLVQKESHLLELARYVVLNPVRAARVAEAGEWRWSAYRALTGRERAPPWLETDWLLSQFDNRRATAIDRFIDFVRTGVGLPSIWGGLSSQIYLGDESFARSTRAMMQASIEDVKSMAEVPHLQRRPPAPPLSDYSTTYAGDPKTGMAEAYATGGYTLQQVAQAFGVHYTTVSRAVRNSRK